MTHYADGTRFEWKTRDDLTYNGYQVVRAAGSKGSTKIDLIGLKPGQLLFIQCKRSGALPPAEWDRVVEVAGWVGAIPLLAANGPRGRGVVYTRLLGPKIPRARTQPCEPFLLDEIAVADTDALYERAKAALDPYAVIPRPEQARPVVAPYGTHGHDHTDDVHLPAEVTA